MDIVLSVVIVAYKSSKVIVPCIQSIYMHNDIGNQLEIIVVDNSPDGDATGTVVQQELPDVTYVKSENRGFGAGNNTGARHAKGKNLLFLNPDTLLVEPVFRYVADILGNDTGIGCAGLSLRDARGKRNTSFLYLPEDWRIWNATLSFEAIRNRLGMPPKRFAIVGADIFISKRVFDQTGGFDENIFMYYEECDLSMRLYRAGYRNVLIREKQMVHLEGAGSYPGISDTSKIEIAMNSLEHVVRKHGLRNEPIKCCAFGFLVKYYVFRKSWYKEYYDKLTGLVNKLSLPSK